MTKRSDRLNAGFLAAALALTASTLFGSMANAEEAEPFDKNRIVYSNLLSARFNPWGFSDTFQLDYRFRLYEDPGALWRDAHLGVYFQPQLVPVLYKVGGGITVQPLTVISLFGGYHFVHYFGNFGYLQSFPNVESDFSDSALDDNDEAGASYATTGHQVHLGAKLIGKVGPIIAANELKFFYTDMDIRDGDLLFHTPVFDTLSVNKGWMMTNDSDVLYLFESGPLAGFLVGIRNSVVGSFYEDRHYADGSGETFGYTDRLGPLLAYIFFNEPGAAFDRPTILLIVNWWLKHRFRTGEDTHQAIPYVVLGFKFEGQLWGN